MVHLSTGRAVAARMLKNTIRAQAKRPATLSFVSLVFAVAALPGIAQAPA